MRPQLTKFLFFLIFFTLILTTAIFAELPVSSSSPATPNTSNNTRSPHLTHFSERDPWVPYYVRFHRVFLKVRRRIESVCIWVWYAFNPEVKPPKEDIFYLRLLENTTFLSTRDDKLSSVTSEPHTRKDSDEEDNIDIRDILRVVETELSSRIPSERRLVIDHLRLKLLDWREALT